MRKTDDFTTVQFACQLELAYWNVRELSIYCVTTPPPQKKKKKKKAEWIEIKKNTLPRIIKQQQNDNNHIKEEKQQNTNLIKAKALPFKDEYKYEQIEYIKTPKC